MKMIVARDRSGVIAVDGQIPWKLPTDMQRFAYLTKRNPGSGWAEFGALVGRSRILPALTDDPIVVMGSTTYMSLPKGPLQSRCNVVLSSRPSIHERVSVDSSQRKVATHCFENIGDLISWTRDAERRGIPVWIIGGAQVYKHMLPLVDEVYLTTVMCDHLLAANGLRNLNNLTIFNEKFEEPEWECIERQRFCKTEDDWQEHEYVVLRRRRI